MPLIKTLISRKIDPNYSFLIEDNNRFYLILINLALLQFLPSVVVTNCNILIFNLVLQHRLMKYPPFRNNGEHSYGNACFDFIYPILS